MIGGGTKRCYCFIPNLDLVYKNSFPSHRLLKPLDCQLSSDFAAATKPLKCGTDGPPDGRRDAKFRRLSGDDGVHVRVTLVGRRDAFPVRKQNHFLALMPTRRRIDEPLRRINRWRDDDGVRKFQKHHLSIVKRRRTEEAYLLWRNCYAGT